MALVLLWRMMIARGMVDTSLPFCSTIQGSALKSSQQHEEKQDKPVTPPTLSTYGAFFGRLEITVLCFMCNFTILLLVCSLFIAVWDDF